VEFEYKEFFKTKKGFRRCMEGHEKCKTYEEPHRVNITNGYYLQSTEATQEQWQEIMGFNPSYYKNCGKDCPIENISYNDIQEFIRRLNEREKTDKYRLPTEAEWEYAARGGGSGTYFFGEDETLLQQYAWYSDNAQTKTNPVARKKPNQWGLYDMHGNVWEWCEDWFDLYPEKEVTDPQGPESVLNQWVTYSSFSFWNSKAIQLYPSRVTRGGSYEEGADGCYVSLRVPQAPDYKNYHLGFRVLKMK
jgi:formylglycine-generating enzyme required for sulfatase activity